MEWFRGVTLRQQAKQNFRAFHVPLLWIQTDHMKADSIHVRMTEQDRAVFCSVAEALGLGDMSSAVRFVMREKHRKLGLALPAAGSMKQRVASAKPKRATP
jgi:hypothetical protein